MQIPNAETMGWEAGPAAVMAAVDNAMANPEYGEQRGADGQFELTVKMPDINKLRTWLGYYERWCMGRPE